jgi:hypothetical protein
MMTDIKSLMGLTAGLVQLSFALARPLPPRLATG